MLNTLSVTTILVVAVLPSNNAASASTSAWP